MLYVLGNLPISFYGCLITKNNTRATSVSSRCLNCVYAPKVTGVMSHCSSSLLEEPPPFPSLASSCPALSAQPCYAMPCHAPAAVQESACAVRFDIGPCLGKSVRSCFFSCILFFSIEDVSLDQRDLLAIVDLRMRKLLDSLVITSQPVGDAHRGNSSWPSL
jgi:hypothetical protein